MSDLNKDIESIKSGDYKSGPRYINNCIKYHKEMIEFYREQLRESQIDLKLFQETYKKHISDIEMRANAQKGIEIIKKTIPDLEFKLKEHQKQLTNFENCKADYIEDAKRGLFYDCDSGDLINTEPLTVPPANAYIPA